MSIFRSSAAEQLGEYEQNPVESERVPLRSGIQDLLRPREDGPGAALRALEDAFVENWGRMAESFAMNRALGRVHALVYVSLDPISLSEIADRLVSTDAACEVLLEELLAYRVLRAVAGSDGEPRYVAELDPWSWFHRTVRERRQREFMPAQRAMRELLAAAQAARGSAPREHAQRARMTVERIERFAGFIEDSSRLIDAFVALGAGPMVTLMRSIARLMPKSRLGNP